MATAAQIRAIQLAAQQKAAAAAKAQAAAAAAKPKVAPMPPVTTGGGIPKPGAPVTPSPGTGGKPAPTGMVVLDPNYKGPTPTKVPSDTGTGGGIQTATPIQKNSVVQQGQGGSYVRFGQEAPIAQGVARGAANVPTNVPSGKKVFSRGGKVKSKSSYSSGGGVKSSASKRGDGIAQRGKTKGRMI